jgi:AcrR family transcriptional regulator
MARRSGLSNSPVSGLTASWDRCATSTVLLRQRRRFSFATRACPQPPTRERAAWPIAFAPAARDRATAAYRHAGTLAPVAHVASRPDQKERIRRQAARLFAENGYNATGVQELSEAVGLGRGALYHHIGSKERLLFEVVTLHVVDVVEEARAVRALQVTAEEKVRRLSRLMMATIASHLPEWTVFFRDLGALSGSLRRDALLVREAFEDVWSGVIDEGVRAGEFRHLDPIVVKGILGMHNYSHVWIRERGRLAPEEIADAFSAVVLDGIRRHSP